MQESTSISATTTKNNQDQSKLSSEEAPTSSSSSSFAFGGASSMSSSQAEGDKVDNSNSEITDQYDRTIRRNALTPESDHIEPIKQTEIQEKMSTLTFGEGQQMGGDVAGHSRNS